MTIRARGREAERLGAVLVHEQHGGGAVGDLRRRAGGVPGAVVDRLERGQSLGGGVAQALVAGDGARSRRSACRPRPGPAPRRRRPRGRSGPRPRPACALRCDARPKASRSVAGQAAALGDPFGGEELVGHVDVPGVGTGRAGLAAVGAQRHARHRLDAAGDADVDGAGGDEPGDRGGWPAAPTRTGRRSWWRPVCQGSPELSQAVRVTLLDCSPAWVTQPPMTCSTSSGSMPARSTSGLLRGAEHLGGVQPGQPAVALARSACAPPRR